ncbi:hypothetical protein ACN9MH_27315 [Paenibacillus silvae]|uniref:hypothetical protein n=1 Tax=Paenibacillus silvae TaxID=1325358 RepID=UPI003CF7666D
MEELLYYVMLFFDYVANFSNFWLIKLLLLYWLIRLLLFIVKLFWDIAIIALNNLILYQIVRRFLESSKTLKWITHFAHWSYFFDKLFNSLRLNIVMVGLGVGHYHKSFEDYNVEGPLSWIAYFKSLITQMFSIELKNIFTWLILLLYLNKENIDFSVFHSLSFDFKELYSQFLNLQIKKFFEELTTVQTIIVTMVTLITPTRLIVRSIRKKQNENKTTENIQKTMILHSNILKELDEIRIAQRKNINLLYRDIQTRDLTNNYLEKMTGTDIFRFNYDGSITRTRWDYIDYSYLDKKDILLDYKSMEHQMEKIRSYVSEIHDQGLESMYRRLNKGVHLEYVRLWLFHSTRYLKQDMDLLSKETIQQILEGWTNSNHYLKNKVHRMFKVWNKEMSEQSYYDKYNVRFELDIAMLEKEIQTEARKFQGILLFQLRASIEHYIYLEQYLMKVKR